MDSYRWAAASRAACASGDLVSAAHAADRALEAAEDLDERAEAHFVLGATALAGDDLDAAVDGLQTAAELKEDLGVVDWVRLEAVVSMIDAHRRLGDPRSALEWADHGRALLGLTSGYGEYEGRIAAAAAVASRAADPERSFREARLATDLGIVDPLVRALAEDRSWEPSAWSMRARGEYADVEGLPLEGEGGRVRAYLLALAEDDLRAIHAARTGLTDPHWRRDAWWESAMRERGAPARALALLRELREEHALDEAWTTAVRHAEADVLIAHDPDAALELLADDESETGRDLLVRAAEAAGRPLVAARARRARGEWGAGARELVEDAYAELDGLVGMAGVKRTLRDWCDLVEVAKLRGDRPLAGHVVMTGNPGTGKTTVARVWGRLLYALDLAESDRVVLASRGDLVGEYVGHTAPKTLAVVERALGGVLFIDEAYSLAADEFGAEALTTLLEAMEDRRDRLSVVVAGYATEIPRLWATNPGLRSRFTRHLDFPDYSSDELAEIVVRFLASRRVALDPEAADELPRLLARVRKDADWANAREMRNLVESVLLAQARRVVADGSDAGVATLSDVRLGGSEWWRSRGTTV